MIHKIQPKTIFINKWGYFFDFIFEDLDKNLFSNIENLKKDELKIVTYPDYDSILKNLELIKQSNAVFFFHNSQKKEIQLLSEYYKISDIYFQTNRFLDFINSLDFSISEIIELSKKEEFFKFIYLFIRLQPIFNLNPSKCFKVNKDNFEFIFTKSDFKNINEKMFPNAYLYYKKANGIFSNTIFLDLVYYDLEGYSNEKTEYLLKLIKHDEISRIDPSEFSEETIKKYEKTIAFRRKNNKLFLIGAIEY